MDLTEKKIKIENSELVSLLLYDVNILQIIESRFKTSIMMRGNLIVLKGELSEIKIIEAIFNELSYVLNRNGSIIQSDIETIIDLMNTGNGNHGSAPEDISIIYHGAKDTIRARNQHQIDYHRKVLENDLVFSIGPAGTGKTFLAVAMALASLRRNEVSRIILSRPAVEAGESLGFLPGDMKEKLDPYLRPLTDALIYMLSPDKMKSLMEKNIIEITPLAYMRGRTLNNAFIILDEAQNATITQMKMFLTRLGASSKAIVTGDVTQVDLKSNGDSGLIHVQKILQKIDGIEFVYFTNKDVIRHRLVAEIIKAYENEKKRMSRNKTEDD